MAPEEYFQNIAEPTVAEFLEDPTNVRRTLLACMACYHVIDALAVERKRKPQQIYDEFVARLPSFKIIKAVALLAKHIEPDQRGFEIRSNHLKPASGAAFSDGSYFSDGSSFAGARKVVTLQSPGFSKTDLTHATRNVMEFLKVVITDTLAD